MVLPPTFLKVARTKKEYSKKDYSAKTRGR